jgi:hypothetical protein
LKFGALLGVRENYIRLLPHPRTTSLGLAEPQSNLLDDLDCFYDDALAEGSIYSVLHAHHHSVRLGGHRRKLVAQGLQRLADLDEDDGVVDGGGDRVLVVVGDVAHGRS